VCHHFRRNLFGRHGQSRITFSSGTALNVKCCTTFQAYSMNNFTNFYLPATFCGLKMLKMRWRPGLSPGPHWGRITLPSRLGRGTPPPQTSPVTTRRLDSRACGARFSTRVVPLFETFRRPCLWLLWDSVTLPTAVWQWIKKGWCQWVTGVSAWVSFSALRTHWTRFTDRLYCKIIIVWDAML